MPSDTVLARLHDILQIAMGWENSHLHEFTAGKRRFGPPDDDDMGIPNVQDERTVLLSDVLDRAGAKALYTYDFGDSWEHEIVLEKVLPAEPDASYPICTAGKGACPPEDCGGLPGFYSLLEALQDPDDEENEELLEMVDSDYDPDAFPLEAVNERLTRPRRR